MSVCRVCGDRPATHVLVGRTLKPYADEVETVTDVACSSSFCLGVLAKMADLGDTVHVGTREIRPALCVDGLIPICCGDEWEFFACMGCPGCEAA